MIFLIYVFYCLIFDKSHERRYQKNYESSISGVLEEDVYGHASGNTLKVDGRTYNIQHMFNKQYKFGVSGSYIDFSDVAMAGDTVRKLPFSDTIYLNKKNEKKYIFYFKKPVAW